MALKMLNKTIMLKHSQEQVSGAHLLFYGNRQLIARFRNHSIFATIGQASITNLYHMHSPVS